MRAVGLKARKEMASCRLSPRLRRSQKNRDRRLVVHLVTRGDGEVCVCVCVFVCVRVRVLTLQKLERERSDNSNGNARPATRRNWPSQGPMSRLPAGLASTDLAAVQRRYIRGDICGVSNRVGLIILHLDKKRAAWYG
jgi:hypothetical protein